MCVYGGAWKNKRRGGCLRDVLYERRIRKKTENKGTTASASHLDKQQSVTTRTLLAERPVVQGDFRVPRRGGMPRVFSWEYNIWNTN